MKRKIIKQGHNTLTLTLPSEWVKRFNLTAGKEVDLIERDNGLFISTEKLNECKKTEIDISKMDIPMIWKYFMSVYREGYDELTVKFDPTIQLESPYKFFTTHRIDLRYKRQREKKTINEVLQGFVDRFIGFEIVEHGKGYIKIKEMGELTSKEFDNSLKRIFLLLQQITEETAEAILKNNPKSLQHIHDVEISIDKFIDYCIRILNKVANRDPRKTSVLFSTLYILELLGDEYKNISCHMIEDYSHIKMKGLQDVVKSTKELFDLYYDLFYKFDQTKIEQFSTNDWKLYLNVCSVYKISSEEEKEIYHHLRMIGRYLNALVELRIEQEF